MTTSVSESKKGRSYGNTQSSKRAKVTPSVQCAASSVLHAARASNAGAGRSEHDFLIVLFNTIILNVLDWIAYLFIAFLVL
jgi:hypothetical protein